MGVAAILLCAPFLVAGGVVAGVLPQPHFDNGISWISPQGHRDIIPSL